MAGNGASGPRPAAPPEQSGLGLRIASALLLVPLAVASVWVGSPALAVVAALAAGLMAWEWGRLVGRPSRGLGGAMLVGTGAGAVLAGGLCAPPAGAVVALAGIVALEVLADPAQRRSLWLAAGLAWIVAASTGFVWLRDLPEVGRETALWILAVVWSVDTAAYAVGRSIGGPKLAKSISPRKTWSGLAGGVVAAVAAGAVAGLCAGASHWPRLALISGALAIVEQMGDIAESYAKRRFGAKDSSRLIPGHGGLLDRLDGMLAVIAAVVVLNLLPGGSLMLWR